MGSPWQYLGHFRRQETGLFASSQAIHTSHFALIQLCCHRSQPKPSATLHRACAGSAESVQGLSFIPRPRGGFCFKMFIYSTCFAVMRQIYFSFPLFQMAVWQKIIFFFYSWRSVCDIFMQNWTSGHNEQDDFCIHVCYRTRAPILHFKNTFNTTLATVSLPPPHYPLISTWKSSDELGLSRLRNVLLSNLMNLDPRRSESLCHIFDCYQSKRFSVWKGRIFWSFALLARSSLYVQWEYGPGGRKFGLQLEFHALIPRVASGQNWRHDWAATYYQLGKSWWLN